MKKLVLALTITSAAIVGMQSCKKESIPAPNPAISETINVQLKMNEAYTFVLPENARNDAYEITSNAQHASISSLGVDANGKRIYLYTPALNYTGTDQVIVSNDPEKKDSANCAGHPPMGNCSGGHHGGDCDGTKEDHYNVTINFTTENSTTSSTTTASK